VVSRTAYRPFGAIVDAQTWTPTHVPEDKGYIGERYDRGAGLQYLNARYYDPDLALFTSPDWFEVTQPGVGTNRYSYSFNVPVNLRDPEGNQARPGGVGPGLIGGARTIGDSIALGAMASSIGILGSNGEIGPPGNRWGNGVRSEPTKTQSSNPPKIGHNGGPPLEDDTPQGGPTPPDPTGAALAVGAATVGVMTADGQAPTELTDFFADNAVPKASELRSWAETQGWIASQPGNGPLKYTDSNGVVRMTIKGGSSRAPGSSRSHVEVRDSNGQRIDPKTGNPTSRRSPENHREIEVDR